MPRHSEDGICFKEKQVLIFRAGPVVQADWANLIAGCSGYFDRIGLAVK
jgi:hypothetical protein